MLVALRGGLAAVLGVLGGSQIIVTGIEAVHVHIHSAGIHGDLIVLAAHGHSLCRSSGCLGTGLTSQLTERNGLFLALLVLLVLLFVMLIAVLILLGRLCFFGSRLLRLLFCLGSFGLFLGLLLGLLLSGLRLFLCGLGAVQEFVQICHAVILAELFQQVVQLVLFQIGAVLLAGAAHGVQLIQDLLGGKVQVLCKITHFIFYDHSVISSSFLIAPQSDRRSKQSFARLRSVTA